MAKKANLAKVSTIDFQETENQAIEAIEGTVCGQSSDQSLQKDVGVIHKIKTANNVADFFTVDDFKFLKNSVLNNQAFTFIKNFKDKSYQFVYSADECDSIWFAYCSNEVDSNHINFEKGKFIDMTISDIKSIIFDSLQITETENQAIEAIEGTVSGQSSDQNKQKHVPHVNISHRVQNVEDFFTPDNFNLLHRYVLNNEPLTFINKFEDKSYEFDFEPKEIDRVLFSYSSNEVKSTNIIFGIKKFLEMSCMDILFLISSKLNIGLIDNFEPVKQLQITEIDNIKPINQISVDGEPEGVSEVFINACNKISTMSAEINDKFVLICVYLHDLKAHYCRNFVLYGCKNIYDFAELRFGFGRTTTKNMISIYEKFIAQAHLKAEFVNYSFSQLVELASVDKSLLSNFNAKMTVKDIRAKKKELVGNNASVGNDNCGLIKQAEKTLQPTVGEFISLIREKINVDVKNPYQCISSSGKAFDKGISAVFDVLFQFDLPVTLETFFKMRCEDKLETVAEVEQSEIVDNIEDVEDMEQSEIADYFENLAETVENVD